METTTIQAQFDDLAISRAREIAGLEGLSQIVEFFGDAAAGYPYAFGSLAEAVKPLFEIIDRQRGDLAELRAELADLHDQIDA